MSPFVRQIFLIEIVQAAKRACCLWIAGGKPFSFAWSCGCCSNPDIRSVLVWSVPWSGTPANTAAHFWAAQKIVYHSIVQTVPLAAHALLNTFLPERPLILPVLILPALVRVKNQICSVRYLCKHLVQHGGYHTDHRTIRYGIADRIAAVQIENRGQIELFSEQAKLRHIRDPFLIRLFGAEVPV